MTTQTSRRFHPAWGVAGVGFAALVGAAGFRSAPSALMVPIEQEFGWSRSAISAAVGVNILLYGLTAPFAAAIMERFGIKRVCATALVLVSAGSALATLARGPSWLTLTWGILIGLGTGSMALVFAALIADRWFIRHRGLVVGVLTAGSATGQLIFLPIIARMASDGSWRAASLVIAAAALAVVPFVLLFLHDHPAVVGLTPYGAPLDAAPTLPTRSTVNPARRALTVLRQASGQVSFWALVSGFAICGATTNGLVGTHFIPSAHDHGMSQTTAAGLLALVGIFDVVGTIFSGWLTDRVNPRILLGIYYAGRGASLAVLPVLLSPHVHPPMFVFIIFYGLDWVATVPPTAALCREIFGADGTVVFGWVFAAHQVGASFAALAAGVVRDHVGTYTPAWIAAAGLCAVAAVVSLAIGRQRTVLGAVTA